MKICDYFQCMLIFLCLLLVLFSAWQLNSQFNEIYNFTKNYKTYDSFNKQIIQDTIRDTLESFTIKGNWLISIDPNNNWIHFQYNSEFLSDKLIMPGKTK